MHTLTAVVSVVTAVVAAAASVAANAQDLRVYQQRDADGRIVLTDRPAAGAQTERAWRFTPEDEQTVRQRRELRAQAAREAQLINERFDRQLAQQRQQERDMDFVQLRLAEAAARLDAQRGADEVAVNYPIAIGPVYGHRALVHRHPPRSHMPMHGPIHRPMPMPHPPFGRFGPEQQ